MAGGLADMDSVAALPAANADGWRDINALTSNLSDAQRAMRLKEWWKYSSLPQYTKAFANSFDRPSRTRLECHATDGISIAALDLVPGPMQQSLRAFSADAQRFAPYPLAQGLIRSITDGWYVHVQGELDAPVELIQGSGADFVFIDVAPHAKFQLLQKAEADQFRSSVAILRIGEGAEVQHAIFSDTQNAGGWQLSYAHLANNAHYENHSHLLSQSQQRHETHIVLAGDGSSTEVEFAGIGLDSTNLDQQLRVEHVGCHTTSREKIHLLAQDQAKMTFNGRIHIHPGASNSDAELQNKNIALSDGVRFNTKPELEIYNDEVRCAHGASVGQLDPEALFLLQARGLSPTAARQLLCSAFLSSAITGPLANLASQAVKAHFQ